MKKKIVALHSKLIIFEMNFLSSKLTSAKELAVVVL